MYRTIYLSFHGVTGPSGLTVETSLSHSDTRNSIGLLWTSDQPDTE